jgi:hypothetical protein
MHSKILSFITFCLIFYWNNENASGQETSPWSSWSDCDETNLPYRRKERSCPGWCNGNNILITNCVEKKFPNLAVESTNSQSFNYSSQSECEQWCRIRNCSAIYYTNGMCSVHDIDFTMRLDQEDGLASFFLPGFSSLFQGIILADESDKRNATNIFDCIKQCQESELCDAASINVELHHNNCLLFQKGIYTTGEESSPAYITWYKTSGIVQNVGLVGRRLSNPIHDISLDICIDKCLKSNECLGIEYSLHRSVDCLLFRTIMNTYEAGPNSISWINFKE